MPKQRFPPDNLDYLISRYLLFVPFEYKNSVRLQNSHTLIKSLLYIILPCREQAAVFLRQP